MADGDHKSTVASDVALPSYDTLFIGNFYSETRVKRLISWQAMESMNKELSAICISGV